MIADGHTTIEHSLPVANIYDDVLQFWRGSKTAYTPTLVVSYGGPFGENYWYQQTDVWKEPILSRWVPRRILDSRSRRRIDDPAEEENQRAVDLAHRQADQRPRHPGLDRRARPARGPRRALGHVELRARRHDPAPGAGDGDDQPGARATASTATSARSSRASSPTSWCSTPTRSRTSATRPASATPSPTASCTTATWTRSRAARASAQPFWFEQSAGGNYTAGATESVPHED